MKLFNVSTILSGSSVTRISAVTALLLFSFIFSCKKNDGNPAPTPTPPVPPVLGTMNINLAAGDEEVIFSEAGGKVLLDTLPPFHNHLVATLRTDQALVDVTVIGYDSLGKNYVLTTLKGVNPSIWSTLGFGGYDAPVGDLSSTAGYMVYTHVPDPVRLTPFLLDDYVGGFGSSGNDYSVPGSLGLNYIRHGNSNYLYLLFPNSGLYNFHIPKGPTDTVDLSKMDTAVKLTFTKPVQYTMQPATLIGIMDTTDFTKSLFLYSGAGYLGIPDMEYPKKLVQKFELYTSATSSTNINVSYYSYGNTVPSALPFPDESAYSISSTQNNNFGVKFVAPHPTYYQTTWKTSSVLWLVYASPDSTTLNPLGLLTALKSKSLKGQDLSGLSLSTFSFENVQGLDYPGFFSYECNPDQVKARRVASSASLTKKF
ncbi:MAG TPA: hypothetical protein VK563_04245 [Puia sp.]|nr:hypothetical protein [Puia sp.]